MLRSAKALGSIVAVLLTVSGCGGSAAEEHAAAGPVEVASVTPLDKARQGFNQVADRPTSPLDAVTLPVAPDGFTRADVEVMADLLLQLMKRSTDPELSAMTAEKAFDHVLAVLPKQSVNQLRRNLSYNVSRSDVPFETEGVLATRLPDGAILNDVAYLSPRLVADAANDDGQRYLEVSLQTFIRLDVTVDGVRGPVIVGRQLALGSYRPQELNNGYWPGVGVNWSVYGADMCAAMTENLVTPATDVSTLRHDTKQLRRALQDRSVEIGGTMTKKDYDFIEKTLSRC
jgi:hypothetical protein